MKNKSEPSLEELRKEIEELKLKKKMKLQRATSMTERNKLLSEINQLDAVKKSPNALRSFGKTFGKGLRTTGKTLWKGITRASRNLDRNAPELKKFAKTMTDKPKQKQTMPDLDKMFFPTSQMPKKKKSKKRKQKARRMVYNQKQEMPLGGLP